MGSSAYVMADINTPKTVYDEWHVFIIQYGELLAPFAHRKDTTFYDPYMGFVHLPYDEDDADLFELDARRCEFREGMPCTTQEMTISDAQAARFTTYTQGQVPAPLDGVTPSTDEPDPRQYLQEMWHKP